MEYLAVAAGSLLFFLAVWKLAGLVDEMLYIWRKGRRGQA